MKILALYTASESRGPVTSQPAVQLRAGCGIVGDRHYRRNAQPAEQITLIESEAIAAFNRDYQQQVEPHTLRRNVLTEGVDLNALEGREFLLGDIRLRGIELCEPCSVVGKLLAGDLTPPQVVKALLGRGGLPRTCSQEMEQCQDENFTHAQAHAARVVSHFSSFSNQGGSRDYTR